MSDSKKAILSLLALLAFCFFGYTRAFADEPTKVHTAMFPVCQAGFRLLANQTRLKREREYAKVGGVEDKEAIYRAARGIVEATREIKESVADFKETIGRKMVASDLKECD